MQKNRKRQKQTEKKKREKQEHSRKYGLDIWKQENIYATEKTENWGDINNRKQENREQEKRRTGYPLAFLFFMIMFE